MLNDVIYTIANKTIKMFMLFSNINEQTEREKLSPLMIAVKGKNSDCVSKLLELGARIDLVDSEGNTVYQYAVLYDPECIRVS